MQGAASTFDLLQDISGAGGPDDGLRALVVVIDMIGQPISHYQRWLT
jgi:hypothetical protein